MPHRLSLAQMAQLIRDRKISPRELVDAHLAQIDEHNGWINAFVMQFGSEARAEALQAEKGPPKGPPKGPLHGIPVTVKDSFDIRDLPTLCGSRYRLAHRAAADSTAVRRLREAGAIILGKTNCPEFLANYETDNHITGRTNNPWNPQYTAGGSSGGESAAISAFFSAGGLGSDGGGSVRIPAHFCGIAGLKPTPGRVPATGHYPEIAHPGGLLGVVGPMARNVRDVRLLFEVLAGYDPFDPFSAPVPLRKLDRENLRVGLMESVTGAPVHHEIRVAVRSAARLLESLGFIVEPFQPKELESVNEVWWFFFAELSAMFTRDLIAGRESDSHWTGREFLDMVARDRHISGREVVEQLAARERMRVSLLNQMSKYPILLGPPCGVTAFAHQQRTWRMGNRMLGLLAAVSQATPFNVLSLPGLVLPMAISAEGMPIGVQLIAGPYEEERLLSIGERMEEARGPFPSSSRVG